MTVRHSCLCLVSSSMFGTWWSISIRVDRCVKDLSKIHENKRLPKKTWIY